MPRATAAPGDRARCREGGTQGLSPRWVIRYRVGWSGLNHNFAHASGVLGAAPTSGVLGASPSSGGTLER